jgi:hypothetical protein
MKIKLNLFAVMLIALVAGCASNNDLLDRENAAVGAGFKIITPTKPEQEVLLGKLPADKVTQVIVGGKPYYVLPDVANNQAYVGGPKQYQAYKQFRQTQEKNAEDYIAPSTPIQVVEVNSMNWGEWGGWSAVGGPDGMGWPGWY